MIKNLHSRTLGARVESGQTMAEYSVVLAIITLVVVLAVAALSGAVTGTLGNVTGIL